MTDEQVNRLAGYYDTHDTSEEMTDLVAVEPARNPTVVFSVRLPRRDAQRLRELAEAQGEQPRTMVRRWIAERIAGEAAATADDEQAHLARLLQQRLPQVVAEALDEVRRSA